MSRPSALTYGLDKRPLPLYITLVSILHPNALASPTLAKRARKRKRERERARKFP